VDGNQSGRRVAAVPGGGGDAPPCRTCGGKKTVVVEIKSGVKKEVACPACRGSGRAGLVTK
jgi:hypothetical protein